ncbi:MAG: hypothetical protein ACTFAK_12840 [Candidatus Electronema sp. VV]
MTKFSQHIRWLTTTGVAPAFDMTGLPCLFADAAVRPFGKHGGGSNPLIRHFLNIDRSQNNND